MRAPCWCEHPEARHFCARVSNRGNALVDDPHPDVMTCDEECGCCLDCHPPTSWHGYGREEIGPKLASFQQRTEAAEAFGQLSREERKERMRST